MVALFAITTIAPAFPEQITPGSIAKDSPCLSHKEINFISQPFRVVCGLPCVSDCLFCLSVTFRLILRNWRVWLAAFCVILDLLTCCHQAIGSWPLNEQANWA